MGKRKSNNIGINVGATVEAVAEARVGIIEILKSGADQETLRAALETFSNICSCNNSSISNCTISMDSND